MLSTINSDIYWDKRFTEDWEVYEGPHQSRFFAQLALENLPAWLIEQIRRESLSVVDWGCAQGDGTDIWASYINSQQLFGVDFSKIAIEQASQRYPMIKFFCENWLEPEAEITQSYDVVFSSNTLEHFHNPFEVLATLSQKAKKAVILALPYREINRIAEHFSTFLSENIPLELDNGFRLIWSKVVDCSRISSTQWSGDQVFLVYADSSWIHSLQLKLSDCELEKTDLNTKFDILNQALIERDVQISGLTQVVKDREIEISNLHNIISKFKDEIFEFESFKIDKEIYIAQLLLELNERNKGFLGMHWKIYNKSRKIPYYIKKSINIIKSRGFIEFIQIFCNKFLNKGQNSGTNYVLPMTKKNTLAETNNGSYPLNNFFLNGDLVIITGVPFDDIGGGQRAAQLARCALKTGRRVVYIYIYKKYDFEKNSYIESDINIPGLIHLHIDFASPEYLLNNISSQSTAIFELPHPKILPYLHLLNARGIRTVFELIDDWETSLGGDWFNLSIYQKFVKESSCVVGTAKILVERLQALGRIDALYLPNAANEYIFDKYKIYKRPHDLPGGNRRIALYFGSLYGEWFAWDYLQEAAYYNSDMDFILIGDKPTGKILHENVHMLGSKKIEELPSYLAHADVALLPFVPGKISDAVSPIKIFEYLFAGKPVVSTVLPEVIGYPDVHIAQSPKEFAHLCANFKVNESIVNKNDKFISENSWFSRLDNLIGKENIRFKGEVSVIILIHNNKSIIHRCLESLIRHCSLYIKDVVVVDNASNDGGAEYIQEHFPTVRVIKNSVNGCASGRNLGVAEAKGEYLAFFDSDQWFTSSSCFEEALHILEKDANVGAIGWAAGWFDSNHSHLGGMITDYCPNRAMNDNAILKGYRSDIGYLGTGGFFIPKVVFDATDGFDTSYDPTCFEDTDLSFQIKKLGLDVCYRDLTGIRHQPHQTTSANSHSNEYTALFKRNSEYFKKKWSNCPHFFTEYTEQ